MTEIDFLKIPENSNVLILDHRDNPYFLYTKERTTIQFDHFKTDGIISCRISFEKGRSITQLSPGDYTRKHGRFFLLDQDLTDKLILSIVKVEKIDLQIPKKEVPS